MEHGHCSNALHAEVNAIANATASGRKIHAAYITHAPCRPCYQLLRAAGVEDIVYKGDYRLHPMVEKSPYVRKAR